MKKRSEQSMGAASLPGVSGTTMASPALYLAVVLTAFARSWEKRWGFTMGLFLALLFLCGHFQVLLGAFYGGLIYFFFRVFSEVVYPGWKVWMDGKQSALLTANYVFRTVFVPAGDNEARFSYKPVWWTPIRVGLGLWFLSVLGIFFCPFRRWVFGEKAP